MKTFVLRLPDTEQLQRLGGLAAVVIALVFMAGCAVPPAQPTKGIPVQEALTPAMTVENKSECTMEKFDTSSSPEANALFKEGMELLETAQSATEFLTGFPSADKAIEIFSQALTIDPEFVGAYLRRAAAIKLANTQTGVNQPGEDSDTMVLADLSAAISIKPACSFLYRQRAIELAAQGKGEEALPDLNTVISLNSADYDALSLRGVIHYSMGKWDEALEDLNRAEKIMPSDLAKEQVERFYNVRGSLHSVLEMWDEAISDHGREIELYPDAPDGYFQRGQAYLAKGEADAAISDFNRMAELDPFFAADWLPIEASKIREFMATLDPNSGQYTQLDKLLNEFGPESGLAQCNKLITEYQTKPFEVMRHTQVMQRVENAEWNTDTLDAYEEALNFYIPAARCFPDQFSPELLQNVSTVLHRQLEQTEPDTELYARMKELAAIVDEAMQ